MTKFETIYRLFLSSINDYRIRNLFKEDADVADDLLETFLMRAIHHFKNCKKPIQDVNFDLKVFNAELDINEINILADLMVLAWMDWNNNNILQMNLSLTDNDCFTVLIY